MEKASGSTKKLSELSSEFSDGAGSTAAFRISSLPH